jgi:hypothetical protein
MDFALLQERLVARIRQRVRSGEVTERGLATLAGVSQPHVHNVLKGVRGLSTDMADHLLRQLHITIFDLIEEEEIRSRSLSRAFSLRYRPVRCLAEPLGPGRPFPEEGDEEYPFRLEQVDCVRRPAVARLAADPDLPAPLRGKDWVLLERDQQALMHPAEGIYVVERRGEAVIRHASAAGGHWLVPELGRLSVQDQAILEVMKAKVVWFGRCLELPQLD